MKTEDFTRGVYQAGGPSGWGNSVPDGFEAVDRSQVMQSLRNATQLKCRSVRTRAAGQLQHQRKGGRVKVLKGRAIHCHRLSTQAGQLRLPPGQLHCRMCMCQGGGQG